MTAYRVLIYCPDQHILYRADTPDTEGVGGGVTARIRLACSLAKLGHRVTMISHVPHPHTHQGVEFLPLDARDQPRSVDVLLMTTSGDQLSLESARKLPVEADLRLVWTHGIIPIQGLDTLDYDYLVAVSNFIRGVAENEWELPQEKVIVTYNGLTLYPQQRRFWQTSPARDPFSLIYTSHPSKGLEAALGVLRLLREKDPRYNLHVYGGNALWGGADQPPQEEPGLHYHGMVSQREVAQALRKASFSLHLQARLEPFALSLVEALGYGCIPIVSPVGGNREAVQDGYNGLWVQGDHQDAVTHQRAADLIQKVVHSPDFAAYLRRNAQNIPWTWDNQAKVWIQHWDWYLHQKGETIQTPLFQCPACEGKWLLTADGYHCLNCGLHSPDGHRSPGL